MCIRDRYYTKRNDLSYTVNYLEKGTDAVLHDPKTVGGQEFGSIITSANEVITIDGYRYDSADKETLIIGTGANVINLYYTKRNDLTYIVNYLELGTNKVIHEQKVVENQEYGKEVLAQDEIIEIDGYTYNSANPQVIILENERNVINLYYEKITGLNYTCLLYTS